MQQSNDSLPDGFVLSCSLKETSQAECIVPVDQSGWAKPNHWNESFIMWAEGPQFRRTVYIGITGAVDVALADIDCHSSISYPAEFEVEVCDIHIGGGDVLRPKKPLVLRASLCDPDGCYRVEVPGIETPIAAFGRNEIIDAFTDLLAHLWKEYALEEDANLKPRAQRLKACLLRDYTVVS